MSPDSDVCGRDASFFPAEALARIFGTRPAPVNVLRLWPVYKKVGTVRSDGPDVIEPISEREPTLL